MMYIRFLVKYLSRSKVLKMVFVIEIVVIIIVRKGKFSNMFLGDLIICIF